MREIKITEDDLLKKIGILSIQLDFLQSVNQALAKENDELKADKPEKNKPEV